MNQQLAFGFLFLIANLLFTGLNILSGLRLTWGQGEAAEGHLIRAILVVVSAIIGQILLFQASQKQMEAEQAKLLENDSLESKQRFQSLHQKKQYAYQMAFALVLLSLLSMVTGTISHEGSFPILHGGLGFLLTGITLASFVLWLRLFSTKMS